MQFDPRTVARETPGVFNEVFPQLTPGIVAHFNSSADSVQIPEIDNKLLLNSTLQRAMLFELGCAVGEHMVASTQSIDWENCFAEAFQRQRKYFDAKPPNELGAGDQCLAEVVGRNLADFLIGMRRESENQIVIRPLIPGLEWIGNGYGGFALGRTLVDD